MSISERLLPAESIPESLWNRAGVFLRLPDEFAGAYERLIDRNNLRALATSRTEKDSPTGGISKAETDQHFAQQFDNSAARAQLALIDVTGQSRNVSNVLVQALSGNAICITDAPCGAGAATYALLSAIAELRAKSVLPRQPLAVRLVGAEISEHARRYAADLLTELRPFLESQAIFVDAEFREWDVTSELSTADLNVASARASTAIPKRLLVIANFSGFLSMNGKLKASKRQLEELFRYASGPDSAAVWIEPQMNIATEPGGILHFIGRLVADGWHRFARIVSDGGPEAPYSTSSVQFKSIFSPERLRPIRLAVLRLDLLRR